MSIWNHLPWKKKNTISDESHQVVHKRMFPPSPIFFSGLLVMVFTDESVGLSEPELLNLLEPLPKNLRPRGRIWINTYLSWTLYKLVQDRYGGDFSEQSIADLVQLSENIDNVKTKENCMLLHGNFLHWFPVFDMYLNMLSDPDAPQDVKESTIYFLAAYAFLKHGTEGPLFIENEDKIQHLISNALREAMTIKWEQYKRMVEIGSPLEEAT